MQLLFVYGTLRDPHVREEVLGRVVEGALDTLEGYALDQITIEGKEYPLLVPSNDRKVSGQVIEVTNEELAKIDMYETNTYRRFQVQLQSGQTAWVYGQ